MGSFRLEPDEAIILECLSPDCLVWGISLCDRFFQSIEFEHRPSSLNPKQAELIDGKLTAVISLSDPGIMNWLDPGGHCEGIIAVRYVITDQVPPVHYRKVRLTELEQHLPAGQTRVSADQRSEILRKRRLAYQQRLKP
jgi:hypothetical protein